MPETALAFGANASVADPRGRVDSENTHPHLVTMRLATRWWKQRQTSSTILDGCRLGIHRRFLGYAWHSVRRFTDVLWALGIPRESGVSCSEDNQRWKTP